LGISLFPLRVPLFGKEGLGALLSKIISKNSPTWSKMCETKSHGRRISAVLTHKPEVNL
jgi:hypothetical protein